ncbi:MAG TPA: SIS domain-containing protein [Ottowia sp.]|uniref:SIS domain-containing protein n=1 Tax=Ottowia sp. TaxID=1898956 RepID=UPI002C33C75A|nr:SIS domain-containing protein [Ottowia sp.]HMN20957.1 SIS domain-containing protein [Ottowia sp.]
MQEQRIHQHFIDSADLAYQWAEVLAHPIAAATQALLACVTGGGKVLVCGDGASVALAQYGTALLVAGFQRPRPELPALALGCDATTWGALARQGDGSDALAAQVRALGGPGDVLLVLTAGGVAPGLRRAIEAAHERDMGVVALTGGANGLERLLRDTDVPVCVPGDSAAHAREAHLLTLHGLCNELDRQLLGDEESIA